MNRKVIAEHQIVLTESYVSSILQTLGINSKQALLDRIQNNGELKQAELDAIVRLYTSRYGTEDYVPLVRALVGQQIEAGFLKRELTTFVGNILPIISDEGVMYFIQYNPPRLHRGQDGLPMPEDVDHKTLPGGKVACFGCQNVMQYRWPKERWIELEVNGKPYIITVNISPYALNHTTIFEKEHTEMKTGLADHIGLALKLKGQHVIQNGLDVGASNPVHNHYQSFDFNIRIADAKKAAVASMVPAVEISESINALSGEGQGVLKDVVKQMNEAKFAMVSLNEHNELYLNTETTEQDYRVIKEKLSSSGMTDRDKDTVQQIIDDLYRNVVDKKKQLTIIEGQVEEVLKNALWDDQQKEDEIKGLLNKENLRYNAKLIDNGINSYARLLEMESQGQDSISSFTIEQVEAETVGEKDGVRIERMKYGIPIFRLKGTDKQALQTVTQRMADQWEGMYDKNLRFGRENQLNNVVTVKENDEIHVYMALRQIEKETLKNEKTGEDIKKVNEGANTTIMSGKPATCEVGGLLIEAGRQNRDGIVEKGAGSFTTMAADIAPDDKDVERFEVFVRKMLNEQN